jgi:hypothetical protein
LEPADPKSLVVLDPAPEELSALAEDGSSRGRRRAEYARDARRPNGFLRRQVFELREQVPLLLIQTSVVVECPQDRERSAQMGGSVTPFELDDASQR